MAALGLAVALGAASRADAFATLDGARLHWSHDPT
jgi:hypothetical protein